MNITDKTELLFDDLRGSRSAVTERGGIIRATAGLGELREGILSIPAISNVGTFIDDSTALIKTVPENSVGYCYLNYIGGMTYKCNNLIPFPYFDTTKEYNGIKYTVNEDGTITANGTASGYASFILSKSLELIHGQNYRFKDVGSGMPLVLSYKDKDGVTQYSSGTILWDSSYTFTNLYAQIANTTVNNITIKPMMVEGTDSPTEYEPYFKGLRNTKVTALKVRDAEGNVVATYPIPNQILAEFNGEGVSGYYDKIDIENLNVDNICATITFDGSENWVISETDTSGVNRFVWNGNKVKAKYEGPTALPLIISNYYNADTVNHVYSKKQGIAITGNGGFSIYDEKYRAATAGDFKTYISGLYSNGAPLVATYAIANPTATPLTVDFSPLIPVGGGYTIEFVNEYGYAVPSKITYQTIVGG